METNKFLDLLDNLSQLSKHSSPSTSSDSGIVSHEEQLQIIKEIKQQVRKKSWLYTDDAGTRKSSDYEVELLKMAPFPPTATDDNATDNEKITYSNDVKKYQSLSKKILLHDLFGTLDVYRERLEYLISTRNGDNTTKILYIKSLFFWRDWKDYNIRKGAFPLEKLYIFLVEINKERNLYM
jgi:hypothetical protein